MKQVMLVGCGSYMDSGYGCPGEWRCLKAAALGDGQFGEPVRIIAFVRCECPGRTVAPNVGMAVKLSQIKPEAVYLTTCLAKAKPACPYISPEEMAQAITQKTGIPVLFGTHDYV